MLVGCTNWEVNLGIFDIHFDVSKMGRYNEAPRKVHIGAMIRVLGHLKHHMKLRIIYDTIFLENQEEFVLELNRLDICPGTVEEIPPDMPYPKVKTVSITHFLNSYHAHDILRIKTDCHGDFH